MTKRLSADDETATDKVSNLQQEYAMRKAQMGDAIQKVIDNSKIARVQVYARSKEEQAAEKVRRQELEKKEGPRMTNVLDDMQGIKKGDSIEGEKLADGFVRSKRNVALRIKDELNNQVSEVEQQKFELMQKLNHALVKLDKLNNRNREQSNTLVEKIKFVRDLQKATSGGDDIEAIISTQMKEEFRKEQQINHRLQEEIKRAEMDRYRIVEQIKMLNGEKEITVQTGDGLHKTFKVTQVNINLLLDDLRFFKQQADDKADNVAQTHDVVIRQEAELADLERRLVDVRYERDAAGQRTAKEQRRWDENIGAIEEDIRRKKRLHQMHIKLCATRHLEETLQRVLRRNKQIAFDWMQATVMGKFVKFGSVWKLHKMLLGNAKRRAKNALLRWFKIACDPMALIKVNLGIPELYAENIQKKYFFSKWRNMQFRRQTVQLNRSLRLKSMCYSLTRYWKRRMKVNFLCWRDSLIRKNEAIRTLYAFASKQRYQKVGKAFMQWRNFKENQDFTARMQALAISTSAAQLQQTTFANWRLWALNKKHSRLRIMRQAFKCLYVSVQRQKQFRQLTVGAFSLGKQSQGSILKQCWDALRINAQQEKMRFATNKLQNEHKPAIQALNFKLNNINRKITYDRSKRSTNCFIKLFGTLLSSYFHHWRAQAAHNSQVIDTSLKQRIIKLHRDNLQAAFSKWRDGRNASIIIEQYEEINEMQAGNQMLEDESRNIERSIQEKVQSSKNSASKKITKLVSQALVKHIQYFLRRWQENVKQRNYKGDQANLIFKRVYQRVLKAGWSKYKRGFNLIVQEEKFSKRHLEIKARLDFKTKVRIFNAIQGYSRNFFKARNFLKSKVKTLDKRNKEIAINLWQKYNLELTKEKHREQQAEQVGNWNELRSTLGQVGDELTDLQDTNKRLTKTLMKVAEKTLQKWMIRSIGQTMQFYFTTWKTTSDDIGYKSRYQLRVISNVHKIKLHMAFRQWCMTKENEDKTIMVELIEQEELGNGCLESSLQLKQREHKVAMDRATRNKQGKQQHQEIAQKKNAEIILKIIKTNDKNNFMSKRRAVFLSWREYIQRRRRCCELLSRAVFAMLAQRTFTEIANFSRGKKEKKDTMKSAKKIFGNWTKCLQRKAFNKWRVSQYHLLTEQIAATRMEAKDTYSDNNEQMTRAFKHYAAVKQSRERKGLTQAVFDAIRKFGHNGKEHRVARKHLNENTELIKKRQFLLKWQARKETTLKNRKLIARGKQVIQQIYRRSVFLNWKREFLIVKRFCCRVDQAGTSLMNLHKHQTFDIIRRYALNRFTNICERKTECRKRLIKIFSHYNSTCLRRALRAFTSNGNRLTDGIKRLKMILAKNYGDNYKRSFKRWKDANKKQEVTDVNEQEDGPVNLQNFHLRVQNAQLERMLLADGSTPNEIEAAIKAKENQYKSYVEQGLCRILCKDQPDLELLPWVIERWKWFTKFRKIWKRIIGQCNIRQSNDLSLSSKLWAFNKWKYYYADRQAELSKLPLEKLQRLCIRNVDKLELMANALEYNDSSKSNLIEQRDELLQSQIGGQRIAFALIRANKERAMQTALSRWSQNGQDALGGKIEDALQKSLAKIAELKDKIADMEENNAALAEQNDEYREGALDGIMMAKHCETLHKDRQMLSVDLADKAITIRKLLEDNSTLHTQLQRLQANKRR